MSAELANLRGNNHKIVVAASSAGVELSIWSDLMHGFGDSLTPLTARTVAALLLVAADEIERKASK